jgi:protease-4
MSNAPLPAPRRRPLLGCAFTLSLLFNVAAVALFVLGCLGLWLRWNVIETSTVPLTETYYSGDKTAADKIAVIRLEGIILEGLLGYVHKQIDQAAGDGSVKAVVLRINSPGGTITASDELHQRLTALTQGEAKKGSRALPLVVSMGGYAASGGYYVAMPAQTLFAEPTTLTGSIGVYVSLPNVKELADKYGVHVDTIKQGEIKDSGSPFHNLTPKEHQVWQDMIDHAYNRFLAVVEKGRPSLRGGLLRPRTLKPVRAGPEQDKPAADYTRYLADGGVWTADKALEYKLIDHLGYLDDAIAAAHDAAGLGDHYRVIQYARPLSLRESLLGIHTPAAGADPARLGRALCPRLWYLAPGHEGAAFAAALEE